MEKCKLSFAGPSAGDDLATNSMGESKCICHTEGSHANIEKIPAIKDEPLSTKLFHFVTKLSLLVY